MEPDQKAENGFSFSPNIMAQCQMSSQMSEKSDASSGWYSEDSQSQLLSQPNRIIPPKQPIPHFDQIFLPSIPKVKKAKYNLPSWTKGLLKTAEENEKLKTHDTLLRHQEDNYGLFKKFVLFVQKTIASFPEMFSQMIKQSTDYFSQKFEKQIEKQNDCLKDMNDSLAKEMLKMKEQHLEKFLTHGTILLISKLLWMKLKPL